MLYGLETAALRKRQEAELEVAAQKMLRFSLGVTRLDRIRNEHIRGTAHVRRFGEEDEREREESTESDPETILCNSVKMMREMLSLSKHAAGAEHRENEYVYDLHYQETATTGWIQDILSVRPYTDEGELVPDLVVWDQEVYEDDENSESNWRNDYPDEEESEDENNDSYDGLGSEELSYSQRHWQCYQREMTEEEEDKEECY